MTAISLYHEPEIASRRIGDSHTNEQMRTSASGLHVMMVTAAIFVTACAHGSGGARHPAPTPLLVEPLTEIRADGLVLRYQGATCTRFVVDSRSGLPGGRVIPCPGGLATSLDGRAVQLMAGSRSIASTTLREGGAILSLDWSSSLSEEEDLQPKDWSVHVDGMRPIPWRPTQEQFESVRRQVQETRKSGSLHAELTVEGGFVINGLPSALTLTIENRNAVPALDVTAVWSAPAGALAGQLVDFGRVEAGSRIHRRFEVSASRPEDQMAASETIDVTAVVRANIGSYEKTFSWKLPLRLPDKPWLVLACTIKEEVPNKRRTQAPVQTRGLLCRASNQSPVAAHEAEITVRTPTSVLVHFPPLTLPGNSTEVVSTTFHLPPDLAKGGELALTATILDKTSKASMEHQLTLAVKPEPPINYSGPRFFAEQFALAGFGKTDSGLTGGIGTGFGASILFPIPRSSLALGANVRLGVLYSAATDVPIAPILVGPQLDWVLTTHSAYFATTGIGAIGLMNPFGIALDLTLGYRHRSMAFSVQLARVPGLQPTTGYWVPRTHLLFGTSMLLTEEDKRTSWKILGVELGTAAAIGVVAGLFALLIKGPRT